MSAKKIAYLSILIALSVVGRIAFGFIPNVQPTTVIIIITALYLGVWNGMLVAVMSAVISNMMMGMGMWTIGQIVAWSIIGLVSGYLGKRKEKIPFVLLVAYSGLAGLLYGFVISLSFYPWTNNFFAYYIAGISFDILHAFGNIAFFIVLYPVLSKLFKDNKKFFDL